MPTRPCRRLPPDIGLSSDAWYGLQLDAALDRVARYATLAEIASVEDHDLLAAPNRRAAAESGLRLTVHGPYDDLEPGSTRERDRRHALRVHRRHLEAAAEIGAETSVVHPDYQGCAVRRDPREPCAPRTQGAAGRSVRPQIFVCPLPPGTLRRARLARGRTSACTHPRRDARPDSALDRGLRRRPRP